ncbi:helix-turn-helix transcriptional regulator [Rothia halotolerans]|uniref:helix-turn-helix transcriptional regulator n=1 Tax=Rothia halotolerans TaxID=405770 RepID=UPI00101E1E0A|nr:helix-turn-helix transcriptional regulator [Rothia halotolerans]
MSFYFSRVVEEIGRALMLGADVRLSGVQGSGRSTVLDHLERWLTRFGYTVSRGRGGLATQRIQGQLVSQFGVAWPPGGSTPAAGLDSAIDRLSALWHGQNHPILLLDDAHEIDGVSAAILRRAAARMDLRVVRAVPHGADEPAGIEVPVSGAAEAGIGMPPMTTDDIVEMAAQLLGATPEPMLAARVLAKSGGNPALAASIIATSRLAGHIVLEFGQWRVAADSLWNRHLAPVIDARLRDLGGEERSTLAAIALAGPEEPSALVRRFEAEPLLSLDRRGLLVESEEHGSPRVHVWPPILADRFQLGTSALARLSLRPERDPGRAAQPGAGHEPPVDQIERRAAMLARRMQKSLRSHAEQRYRRWAADPSEAHALRYLDAAYGFAVESERFREVLAWIEAQGPRFSAGYLRLLRRTTLLSEPEREPRHIPEVHEYPESTTLAEAISVIADEGLDQPLGSPCDEETMGAVVSGRVDAVSAEPAAANRLGEVLVHAVGYLRGGIEDAVRELRRILEEASLDADRDAFLMASHVTVLIQRYWGGREASRSVLSTALSVGQPGVLSTAVFGAMLHWAAIDAHDQGRPALRDALIRDGSFYAPGVGPFYGMGTDFVHAIVGDDDAERFDEAVARVVSARLERGFVVAALHVGLNALQRHVGPTLLDALAGSPAQPEESLLAFLAPLARAIREGEAEAAGTLLAGLPEGFRPTASRILAASMRWWRAQADDERAEAFAGLLDPSRDPSEEALKGLSKRELEIAMMARMLSNAEIAERLGLSVRTVENHVANALRKTGLRSRVELARRLLALRHPEG